MRLPKATGPMLALILARVGSGGTSLLSQEEQDRYRRHLVLPEVGERGQEKLKQSSVLLVGMGGLGSPLGLYLAAAGVGRLGLLDFDRVTTSNLQRQVLYGDDDVERPKVEAAAERLRALNPHVEIEQHPIRGAAANILDLIADYDIVADGSDNFAARYLVNDACIKAGKPLVWGAVHRFEGQVAVWGLGDGPCYRCLFPEPPPAGLVDNCAEAGVLGVVPGVIGSLQGVEVIKVLLGIGEPLAGRLLIFDALGGGFRQVTVPRDAECPTCARPGEIVIEDLDEFCAPASAEIQPHELAARLRTGEAIRLLDVRPHSERTIASLPDSMAIPMREIPSRLDELEPGADWVVYCHLGIRSAQAAAYLRQQGVARARSLAGGIDLWSQQVDPDVPRY